VSPWQRLPPLIYSTTSNHIDAAVDVGHAVILLCRLYCASHSASSSPLVNNVTALAAAALGPTSLAPSVHSHRHRRSTHSVHRQPTWLVHQSYSPLTKYTTSSVTTLPVHNYDAIMLLRNVWMNSFPLTIPILDKIFLPTASLLL
jgi:hypothetical protein